MSPTTEHVGFVLARLPEPLMATVRPYLAHACMLLDACVEARQYGWRHVGTVAAPKLKDLALLAGPAAFESFKLARIGSREVESFLESYVACVWDALPEGARAEFIAGVQVVLNTPAQTAPEWKPPMYGGPPVPR